MAKKENPTLDESTSKLEAIKNLIFGENIAQYNSEFDQVKKEIAKRKADLEDYIDEVRKELTQSIDNLGTDLNIRISDLEESLTDKLDTLESTKVNKTALGELLVELGERIKEK